MYRSFFRSCRCSLRLLFCVALVLGFASVQLHGQTAVTNPSTYLPSIDTPSNEAALEVVAMQRIADQWDEAVQQHDPYALDLVLSPKLVDISSGGQVTHRDELVALVTKKKSPIRALDQKVSSVRVLGDVAIVNGTYNVKFPPDEEHRARKDETGIYSQVFERLSNSWVCINSQRTALVAESGRSGDKKKGANNPAVF